MYYASYNYIFVCVVPPLNLLGYFRINFFCVSYSVANTGLAALMIKCGKNCKARTRTQINLGCRRNRK